MATDPVQSIIERDFASALTLDLGEALRRLAALEPSIEAPYLTVSLDWRPEGLRPNVRSGRVAFEQGIDKLLDDHNPHTPAHDSLSADIRRIHDLLTSGIPPEAQSIIIVACDACDVFDVLFLAVPIPTRFIVGPTPALVTLAQVADDYPVYAVLLADQREAVLTFVSRTRPAHSLTVEGTDYPRKQQQGGWSQRRYQARADERVHAFAKTVAEETRRALDEARIKLLIVAAEEVIGSPLAEEFHQTVTDRIVGHIHLSIDAGTKELLGATLPLIEQTERTRELETVQTVENGVGAATTGVAGAADVLTALQTGQVMTLVMNDDFQQPGWADFTLPLYGAGDPPREHPAGGDVANIGPMPLEEELIRLAAGCDATIEIVKTGIPVSADEQAHIPDTAGGRPRAEAARHLDRLGGVGAILRYALDEDRPTAEG